MSAFGKGPGTLDPREGRRAIIAAVQVLLVEDDDTIASALAEALARERFAVTRAGSGGEALAAAPADVVLLDLGLPDMDGLDVCRRLRERSAATAIIVITARGEEADRVIGLELGADDYLVKPFGFRELLARIRAVTRRALPGGTEPVDADTEPAAGPIVAGCLLVDPRTHTVDMCGSVVELTPREFELLAYLAREPFTVHRRNRIIEDVWDPNWYGPTRTLDVHVAALRKKLGDPNVIETVRGVGFRLIPPDTSGRTEG